MRVDVGETRSHASPKESGLRRVVVTRLFGTWSAARAVAARRPEEMTREAASASSSFGSESISLPKPRESTAKTEDLRGGEPKPEPIDLQVLLIAPADFAHNSGR